MEYLYEIHEGNLNLYRRENLVGGGAYSVYYSEIGENVLSFLSQVPNKKGNLEETLLNAIDKAIRRSEAMGKIIPNEISKVKAKDICSDKISELDLSKLPNIKIED